MEKVFIITDDEFDEIQNLIKVLLRPLYKNGQTNELLERSKMMLEKIEKAESSEAKVNLIAELRGCRAWAFYRQKDFVNAEKEALLAGKNETALRCLAAIAAYYYKDLNKLEFYAEQVPPSTAIDNARQILSHGPAYLEQVPKEDVIARAMYWVVVDPIERTNTANIMNNTARFLFDQANALKIPDDAIIITAIGFMQSAIGLYGTGNQNLHHRASAHFWVSKMQEKLFGKEAAIFAAEMSVKLWEQQVVLDLTNKHFISSYEGAKKHLQELQE